MKMQILTILSAAMAVLTEGTSFAHPVSYKGAVGVMTWNQPFLSDNWITYSFASNAAVAVRAMRMEMPGGRYVTYFPQIDYLLKRWNNPSSQANIYTYGGVGGARFQGHNGYAGQVGIEADAESRSWFIMGKLEAMWSNVADDFYHGEFRVGLAPYEAEFNEIASWLMIQLQVHPALREKYVITPLYRMFYKNVLWEAGVSIKGDWMLNFMFHF
jgi:hypothetical protein